MRDYISPIQLFLDTVQPSLSELDISGYDRIKLENIVENEEKSLFFERRNKNNYGTFGRIKEKKLQVSLKRMAP